MTTSEQLQALIAQAKTRGYRTTKTDDGGWLVEQTGSTIRRVSRFTSRYRIGSDGDLIRLLAELIIGNRVGVGYPTTLKPPSELPPLAADHGTRVWGPRR